MKTTPRELFDAGVHIGHQRKRLNPKTKPYIYGQVGGVTIIDLEKTCEQIERSCDIMQEIAARGDDIWFIGTKKQAQDIIREGASVVTMPYCASRWLGGCLTNFTTVERSLNKYKKFLKMEEDGSLAAMYKKEAAVIRREMTRMHRNFEGLLNIKKLPGALFIVDIHHEDIAVAEAKKLGIPVVAIVDTNSDPTLVDYPIMANDDAVKSIRMVVGILLEGIQDGIRQRVEKKVANTRKLISKEELVGVDAEVSFSDGMKEEMASQEAAKDAVKTAAKAGK